MTLTDGDFVVREMRLRPKARGVTVIDEDGFATIYINEYLSDEAKYRTLNHELRHLLTGDHYSSSNIGEIEEE